MKAVIVALSLPILFGHAAEKPRPRQENSRVPAPASASPARARPATRPILYKPPRVGMPKVTAACGTRGNGDQRVVLSVLAPDHVGWTTQASPMLWWRGSGSLTGSLELTLVIPGQADPVLQLQVREEDPGAWNCFDLARHHVKLQPGLTYEWALALIVDPLHRSKDLVASGRVQRMKPPAPLAARLGELSLRERIPEFARNGFWYDAISDLALSLRDAPTDAELLRWGVALREQGGLEELGSGEMPGIVDFRAPISD